MGELKYENGITNLELHFFYHQEISPRITLQALWNTGWIGCCLLHFKGWLMKQITEMPLAFPTGANMDLKGLKNNSWTNVHWRQNSMIISPRGVYLKYVNARYIKSTSSIFFLHRCILKLHSKATNLNPLKKKKKRYSNFTQVCH